MPHHKLPISMAMVVYHDEALIRRALESCADLIDDLVVVHDGPCQDRTLEIAREYTSKVFEREHVGAPEPHRPFSFEQAKNNWVLQLDSDEYLDTDFRQQLADLIKKDVSGYTVNWIEETNGHRFVNMIKEVLFQKNRVFYLGAPNEYVKPLKASDPLVHANVGLVNAAQVSNYQTWADYTRKYRKFAKIQARIYTQPFAKVATWNYSGSEWDHNTQLKIYHPIILGVVGMNLKYLIQILQKIMGQTTPVSLAAIWHLMWYNTTLYWQVFQLSNRI